MLGKNHIIIFMATYNGDAYLAAQLDSIINQTHVNWQLWVSDDGSNDTTLDILTQYQMAYPGKITVYSGPKAGFAANFLSLVCKAKPCDADFFAYADQDDLWAPQKLQQAVIWFNTIDSPTPKLYCSRTTLINAQGKIIGYSPLFAKNPCFANALVQNIASGNTMVFDRSTLALICRATPAVNIGFHDWWTYLLVSGAGGVIYYDALPQISYRQHQNNVIGHQSSALARLKRLYQLLVHQRFKHQMTINLNALACVNYLLTQEHYDMLERLTQARQYRQFKRWFAIKSLGLYRQTVLGNVSLMLAVLLNKL